MQAKDAPRSNPKGKVATKLVVEDRPPPPINIQNFVDKKLQPSKRIEIPASEKFPNAENDANSWSISVMTKYLKEKLELPQYAESFKRHEIGGLKFISMNESNFVAAEVGNKFHAMKLASHAELLRELVLEKAHIDRPDSEVDWSVANVAAWLTYDKSCPETALCTLKAKLNGYKLKDLTGQQAVSAVGAADLPEAESAISALDGLAKKVHAACEKEDEKNSKPETNPTVEDEAAVPSEAEEGAKLKKKKKNKTAIQKRREKQQQDEAGLPKEPHSTQDDLEGSDSELNIIRNDSLPVPQKKKGNTSEAFSSAMSNIFAEVHDVAGSAAVPATKPTATAAHETPSDTRRAVDENAAYGKVDLTETEKSAVKKTSSVPPVTSGTNLERDLLDAKFEEIQRGDQEDPDLFRMEGYKKSKERKKFTSKIASLRKIVAEHAQTMHELREQAHILKSENLMIKEQQKMLLREGGASQELIATLVHDRNIALSELEKVVSLYDEHTSREREEVVRDLRSLARDTYKAKSETEDIWRNRTQQMAQMGNLEVGTDLLSPQRPTTGGSGPARRSKKGRRQRNGDSDSSGSDLEDEFDRTARPTTRPISAPVPTIRAVSVPAQATAPPPVASEPVVSSHVVSTPAPKVSMSIAASVTPAPEPTSAPSSIQKGTSHPLAVARTLLATTGVVADNPSSAPANGTPPTDLMRMVDRTADATLALWQGILRTYRVPRSSRVEHYSDNKLILRSISVPWQRLGHQMLQDARSAENKDVRKALKGLEKCAKKAVLGATRAAKRALESTTDTLKSTTTPSKPAQLQNATGALKKSTRSELGSTAFPVDDSTPVAGDGSAGSSVEEVNCHHRASGMVFGLALVNRIMNRYSAEGEDKTQLLYLLNKINHGELPVTEISRDNMRDFLDSHIGIDLKWDKFDSVCQKLDPDRNGFISTPSVILAFSQLTPLSDRAFVSSHTAASVGASASTGFDPELGELMLLSIATSTMAKPKQAIGEAFMSLILHNSKSSVSFAKFIEKEHDRVGLEDKGYVPDAISPRSSKITPDARVAEQQLFATDILYELTKEFVYKAEAMPDLESRKLPKSSKQDLKESQKRFVSQKKHVSFLCQQHHEACGAVARGVQVYAGGSRKALVDHLSTFVLTFLSFRRKVVTSMLETSHSAAVPASTEDGMTLSSRHHDSTATLAPHVPKLSAEQLQQLLLSIETNIATLTGLYKPREENDPASDHYSPMKPKSKGPAGVKLAPDALTLQEYDLIIAELLGIPLPKYTHCDDAGGGCTGMARMQAQVETVLFTINLHFALEEGLMVIPPEPPKPLASSLALKDLQQTLFKELWQGEAPIDETLEEDDGAHEHAVSPAKTLRATQHVEGPPINVVEEVNTRMHKQRVEQATLYLEILNDKAVKRKKAIRGLMNLWQAAKMAVTENNKISKFASASEIEHKRQIALPVEDILFQTKSIQTQLVADMQEKSTTKLSQLSQRINLLRQGIASQSIPDEDLAVAAQLREISLLENALLQANADAMRLAARIVQQLTSKKVAAATAHAEEY